MRISQDAKDIFASFQSDTPKGHKEIAYRIMAFMEALPPTEQRRRKSKDKKGGWVPELATLLLADKFDSSLSRADLEQKLRSYVIAYQPLYNAEQDGEDCTIYWAALDRGVKPYLVVQARQKGVLPSVKAAGSPKPVSTAASTKADTTKKEEAPVASPAQPAAVSSAVAAQRSAVEPVVLSVYQSSLAARAAQLGVSRDVMLQLGTEVLLVYGTGAAVESSPRQRPERHAGQRETKPAAKPAAKKRESPLPMAERLCAVIGSDECTKDEVLDRLKARGWYPNKAEPRTYMTQTLSRLSADGGILERVRGGVYRVRVQSGTTTGPEVEPQAKAEPPTSEGSQQLKLHLVQSAAE